MNKNDAEFVIKDTIEYANNEIEKYKKRSRWISIASLVFSLMVVLTCIIIYFCPMSLSNIIRESKRIDIIINEYRIENGVPSIESVVYNDLTAEQKEALLNVLEEYDYRRTFGTLLSDGSITDLADKTITIFAYDNHSSVAAIFVAASGEIAINDKSYVIENADQLFKQIIEIVEQP